MLGLCIGAGHEASVLPICRLSFRVYRFIVAKPDNSFVRVTGNRIKVELSKTLNHAEKKVAVVILRETYTRAIVRTVSVRISEETDSSLTKFNVSAIRLLRIFFAVFSNLRSDWHNIYHS